MRATPNVSTSTQSTLRTTAETLENNAVAVHYEGTLPATPLDAFSAFTTRDATSAWIWPIAYEPCVGGREGGLSGGEGGAVTVWEPGRALSTRVEGDNDWYNQLDYVLTPTADGQTHLSYTHSTVFPEDFDTQLEACTLHTDLYNHSLGEYLAHFNGRAGTATILDGPDTSATANAFGTVLHALSLSTPPTLGEQTQFDVPGIGSISAVVDYATDTFLGLRDADTLYRVFGRGRWGWPTGISIHRIAPAGASALPEDASHDAAWQAWLDGLFANAV